MQHCLRIISRMDKGKEHNCIIKDELLELTKANIAQYGLQVIMVGGSDYSPCFAYSIGLFRTYKQPEIICFGLPKKLGHDIINDVADLMKNGEAIKTYTVYGNIFKNSKAEFLPVDDRNIADFKFREAKNLGIFTTRQWLELDKPILRVVHNIDGDWQFLTGDQMPEDIRLVALEQMVSRDKSLNKAFDLDYGYSLDRNFIGGDWTKTKVEDDKS